MLTKAISDVDACAEGMRKFTTEIFDTGVVLVCYIGLLLWYDVKIALLSLLFPPLAYFCRRAYENHRTAHQCGVSFERRAAECGDARPRGRRIDISYLRLRRAAEHGL